MSEKSDPHFEDMVTFLMRDFDNLKNLFTGTTMIFELGIDFVAIICNMLTIKYAKVKLQLIVDPSINTTKNLICYWLYHILLVNSYL